MRTLFLRTAGILLPLLLSTVLCAQSGAIDTAAVPEGFRPYVHLLGSAEVIAPPDGPDTLFMPDVDCWIAMQEQDGYVRTDSLNAEGKRMLLRDPDYEEDMGMKAAFLLVHLLDRQNPGMLDFADDYAKAIKLPYWRTIKMFSRLTGYRLNRSYDPEGADGRIEHIIRKHGLDRLDPPCSPE